VDETERLCFEEFALDLTRGCLRSGDRDIDLRPKAFVVLHHLAKNAGRLDSSHCSCRPRPPAPPRPKRAGGKLNASSAGMERLATDKPGNTRQAIERGH
jgi:hypothetical protein